MRNSPCGKCENKGCGTYHNECPEYLSWKQMKNDVVRKKSEYNNLRNDYWAVRSQGIRKH